MKSTLRAGGRRRIYKYYLPAAARHGGEDGRGRRWQHPQLGSRVAAGTQRRLQRLERGWGLGCAGCPPPGTPLAGFWGAPWCAAPQAGGTRREARFQFPLFMHFKGKIPSNPAPEWCGVTSGWGFALLLLFYPFSGGGHGEAVRPSPPARLGPPQGHCALLLLAARPPRSGPD